MPVFQYSARKTDGQPEKGTAEAADREHLAAMLRTRGLLVIEMAPVQAERKESPFESLRPRSWLSPTKFDVEIGLQQLAVMLHSGLGILEALKTVAEQSRRKRMARVWRNIGERIEEGATFSVALTAHPKYFSSYIIQLVRVGEQSGTLDVVLSRGAEHLSRVPGVAAHGFERADVSGFGHRHGLGSSLFHGVESDSQDAAVHRGRRKNVAGPDSAIDGRFGMASPLSAADFPRPARDRGRADRDLPLDARKKEGWMAS